MKKLSHTAIVMLCIVERNTTIDDGIVKRYYVPKTSTETGELPDGTKYERRVWGTDGGSLKGLARAGLIRPEKLNYSYSITEEGVLYLETERAKYKRTIANGGPAGSEP